MLVLTRKAGQGIIIGSNIGIKVLDVKGKYVSIGIVAPQDLAILRDELLRNNKRLTDTCERPQGIKP